ncbi:P-loop containing nucleoside triphosphate hydrolase protein [Mycena pura]|uniref:P-loop containing nucleoside triphosphate hydrolase protein n=1 Tax=Mycena pura TaxID=153505 RepID=A0AAD6YCB1_9AGAR|nr:P-loop containing nucleoside triphosphate hydrolase protein [Mycena pura]
MVSTPEGASFSPSHQLSASQYASQRKELLGLMSQLRSVGAQGELDLPRIVVIGNQSAGKSSVVEAISGIKVPRDSGTCTRCPMECRLASGSTWTCRIYIRREFDADGHRLREVSEQPLGGPITDKNEVETMLRRAQLAVLDPGVEKEVMNMTVEQLKDRMKDETIAKFSQNVVCVDLEGPDLTELQFVDLPGLIQNATPEVVRLVEEMVVGSIGGNCLILVTIPMTDDMENQKAMRLAIEQDSEGVRTIGVLTKPDILSGGSTKLRAEWLDVIEGRRHKLLHGYYCTRQPDDEERSDGITTATARKTEAAFFQRATPWAASAQQQRFGTDNLVSTLSTLLVEITKQRLPEIMQTAHAHLQQCRAALAALPEASTENPATQLLTLITEFSSTIKRYVRGSTDPSVLIRKNHNAFGEFKRAIRRTAPGFVAVVDADGDKAPHIINDDDEEGEFEEDEATGERSRKPIYLSDVREALRKARARELPGDVPPAAKAALIADFQETWGGATEKCLQSVRESMMNVLLQSAEHFFGRYSKLQKELRTVLTDLEEKHADDCATYLAAALDMEMTPMTQNDHYLQATNEKWVGKYRDQRAGKSDDRTTHRGKRQKLAEGNPAMFSFSSTPVANSFGVSSKPSSPFAFAGTATTAKEGVSSPSDSQSDAAPSSAPVSRANEVQTALVLLAQLGYGSLKEADLGRLRPADEYEPEILLMGGVRAYFQVSYKRIIDNVPGLIDTKFVKSLANGLQVNLIRKFKLGEPGANAGYADYLTEDPAVVAKRAELTQRLNMLEGVQKDLLNFGG